MSTLFDLIVSMALLTIYAFSYLYAKALLQQASGRNGQPHYARSTISFGTIRKYIRFNRFDPAQQKAHFLYRLSRISLLMFFIYMICSLSFERKRGNHRELFFITRNIQGHAN